MPLSLNPRPIVRLWLLADILLGRDLHPLLPRKRTLALTPLSNRAALRALIGNPTRYFALWAVFLARTGVFRCSLLHRDGKNRHAHARLTVGITVSHHLNCQNKMLEQPFTRDQVQSPAVCGVTVAQMTRGVPVPGVQSPAVCGVTVATTHC